MCILLVKKLESMPFCVQHDDKESKFKEQHAKMWENIAGPKRYSRPVVSTLRGDRPRRPRRSDASAPRAMQGLRGQR